MIWYKVVERRVRLNTCVKPQIRKAVYVHIIGI